jgi:hypothetical protein
MLRSAEPSSVPLVASYLQGRVRQLRAEAVACMLPVSNFSGNMHTTGIDARTGPDAVPMTGSHLWQHRNRPPTAPGQRPRA